MEIINPDVMENLENLDNLEISMLGGWPPIGFPVCPDQGGGGGCVTALPGQDCKRRLL